MNSFQQSDARTSRLNVINPATGEPLGDVLLDDVNSVHAAIERAKTAFETWSVVPAPERAALLQQSAINIRNRLPELALLLSQESGKPQAESEAEVGYSAEVFDHYAGVARSRGGTIPPVPTPGSISLVIKEPLGVIGAIVPWNYPLLLWAWKAAPAIASGNTVVAKPSPETPLSLPAIADCLSFPKNVHVVVQGGQDVGEALVEHPYIAKIAFTGSSAVGKSILAACAKQAKRSAVEMSGHDALIVWDDVDLDLAAEGALFAAFVNAGQVCTSTERVYVKRNVYQKFLAILVDKTSKLRSGEPDDPITQFGPMISDRQRKHMTAYVEWAQSLGATIECGGRPIERPGFFFEPTVITGLAHDAAIARGEVFGPIVTLFPVDDFEEAIKKSNDTPFGLSATVFTASLERAMQAATGIRSGTVWINNALMDNFAAPFGGFRQAGIGRELGDEGFDAFLETKHVSIDFALSEKPWWFRPRDAAQS